MTDATISETPDIRRHADGSIDTKHYMQIGRQRRSEALYQGSRAIACFGTVVINAVKRTLSLPVTQHSGDTFANI